MRALYTAISGGKGVVSSPRMITAEALTKRYGDRDALRDVSFAVPAGTVCGLLGPNGAGKSTTAKILAGLLRPDGGRATVAGFDVVVQPLEVKRRLGYLPDNAPLYETLSAFELLALVGALHGMDPDQVDATGRRMLELFGLDSAAAGRRLAALSKGQRQRVALTAAVLHDPAVVILDEPLSGLDANAALAVKDLVRGLADRGRTVLYCSHFLDIVERLCDHVLILDRGVLVAQGPPAELIAARGKGTLEQVFRELTQVAAADAVAQDMLRAIAGPS